MILTCAKCGRRHPLSEEDVVAFHPRFFCLSCGQRIAFEVEEKLLSELRGKNDRERRLSDGTGASPPAETMRRVRPEDGAQGMDGG